MYAARHIAKERSQGIKGSADTFAGKSKMSY